MKRTATFFMLLFMILVVNGQTEKRLTNVSEQNTQSLEMRQARTAARAAQAATQQPLPVRSYAPSATASVVFSEGFESSPSTGGFPTGWLQQVVLGGIWTTSTITGISAHSGSKCAKILYDDVDYDDNNAWLFSPGISLSAGTTYIISFWLLMEGYDGYEDFEVKIGTAQSSTAMTSTIFANPSQDYPTWTQITTSYTPTTSGTYYIGFHDYSPFETADYAVIDDIVVESMPEGIDGGVIAITSPSANGAPSVTVRAIIKNFAATPITSTNVSYQLDNNTPVTEIYTGNLAGLQTAPFQFTTTFNLTDFGPYTLKVWTDLSGDIDHSNDTTTLLINYQDGLRLYGYRLYEDSNTDPYGFVSFLDIDPTDVFIESSFQDGTPTSTTKYPMASGEYFNTNLYAYSYTATSSTSTIKNFLKLSENWTTISSTSAGTIRLSDMTYDYSTHTVYGISRNTSSISELYKIDTLTGVLTLIGSTGQNLNGLACNLNGQLYGVSSAGNLYRIAKSTGTSTLVGSTGSTGHASYTQSMAFDHNSGRLFWALCNNTDGKLVEINPLTGAGTLLGLIGANSEISMLYTPYDISDIPAAPTSYTATPDPGGALSCQLSWTNPALTFGGDVLSELTYVIIERDGIAVDTIENPVIGATGAWTDTSPTNGIHTYTVHGTNSAGVGYYASQTVFVGIDPCAIAINTFPWNMGFEGNGTVFPDCWTQEQINGTTKWAVVSTTGTPSSTHGGTYKARYYSTTRGERAKLVTSKIDLSGLTAPVLKFWHTQQKWGSDQDTLRIYYKTSATGTWTLLRTYDQDLSSWTERSLLLPNPSNDYYIAFDGKAQYGYGVQLDDIMIRNAVVNAAVLSINQPSSAIGLTSTETVQITVKNLGDTAIVGLPVTLVVNGTVVANETITTSIAPNAEYLYTFTAKANLSVVQTHTIKVYSSLANDVNAANDTITKSVANLPHIYDTQVLSMAQPNSGIGLTNHETVRVTVKNLSTDSVRTVPITLEVNGTVVANETISATIAPNAEYVHIFSATADLSAIQTHTVKVYTRLVNDANRANDTLTKSVVNTSPDYDAAVIYILQPNSGTNLSNQETVRVLVKNLSTVTLSSTPIVLEVNGVVVANEVIPNYIAPTVEFTYTFIAKADLSAIQTHIVRVYVNLPSDFDRTNDTLTKSVVNTYANIDAAVLAINQPVSGGNLTNHETVQAVVKNLGDNAISNLPIKLEVNGTLVASETISASIAPNTEYTHTFTATANLAAIQVHTVKVFTTLPNDANRSNDTISKEVEHYEVPDAGVIAIISPTIGGSATETVTATLKNFGNIPITSMTVAYTINGGAPVEEPFMGNLASNMTTDFEFGTVANLSANGNYIIKVYTILADDADSTNDTVSVEISYSNGIADFSGSNVEIYPNPAVDKVTITQATGAQARIYDVSGKLLIDTQIQHDTEVINIGHLVSGVYFIELQDRQNKVTRKLIKQ